jgi:nicotinate dehydrogenase subunit B
MEALMDKEFSRKTFLKGGGALVIGFSLAGSALAGKAAGADPTDLGAVDTFIAIHADNTASIRTGQVELGQGTTTGLLMIAAEELAMDLSQLSHVRTDTAATPYTGGTWASHGISQAGPMVRAAAATARQALVQLAADKLGVPERTLVVSKGVVCGAGRSVSYGDLLGDHVFNVRMAAPTLDPGVAPAKPPTAYTLVGKRAPRIDIPEKVAGLYTYIHDVRVPGMLHGRVVRPRGQMVYGFGAPVLSVDASSIAHIPDVRIVRQRDFVGVVSPREYHAVQAAAQLKVRWAQPPAKWLGNGNMVEQMRAQDGAGDSRQLYLLDVGDVDRALENAAHVVTDSFAFSHNALQPIGADCAVADVTPNGAVVFCSSSDLVATRRQVSRVTGLREDQVRVIHYEASSSFGGAQPGNLDIPKAAAVMSQLAGAPVRLQWMRWDDHGWASYGPGTLMDIRAGVDANGHIVAYDLTRFYPQYKDFNTDTTEELLGKSPGPSVIPYSAPGSFAVLPGIVTKAPLLMYPGVMYNLPNQRFLIKSLPLRDNWFKAQWVRSGPAPISGFGSEQIIDELARRAGFDPIEFRLRNLSRATNRDRLLAVIDAAPVVSGRGFGVFDSVSPSATVADVEVNTKTGKLTVKHIFSAASGNLNINPGLVENQITGAAVQMTSRTVLEELRYSRSRVTSLDWVTYPILRFKDAPDVTPVVVQRIDQPPIGVGEPVSESIPAAIANAFFDATGVRMHTTPMTPPRVRGALEAAAVKR